MSKQAVLAEATASNETQVVQSGIRTAAYPATALDGLIELSQRRKIAESRTDLGVSGFGDWFLSGTYDLLELLIPCLSFRSRPL